MPPARRRPRNGHGRRGARPAARGGARPVPRPGAPRRAPGTRTPVPATPGSARARAERRSAILLVYLSRLPRWLPFAVALGLAVFGALVHGPAGAVALGLVALFLAWLAYLSWPALTPPARVLRAVATLAVVGAAVAVY